MKKIVYVADLAINYLCVSDSSCSPDTYGIYGFKEIYCCHTNNCNKPDYIKDFSSYKTYVINFLLAFLVLSFCILGYLIIFKYYFKK
jgi:hypothetical protein